ncbi:ubiquitin-like protein Pup [Falsarthrobacter nasiphocae]|uniref:Prokaryotic ubiquitin-like protein Pup n=1 Tax=Falsarthrobacter nasiphocae TaxID=189863 RepID=A0AAE3YE71_9MICC|nr:ubiquitin-like protein Pup [Falsarthrobacter nasiphocae]MDR6891107.1 ubiquitin-like protein Pup [Falsarthrobacter nasiphocae]
MSRTSINESASEHEDGPSAGDVFPAEGRASQSQSVDAGGLDDLLADIDSVLTANAEEFVSGFVQKGGQ